jgi:hypothetical protein
MTLEELEASWAAMPPADSPDAITGRRARGMPREQSVYLAVDGHRRRHLLIEVPENTTPVSFRETRGLEVVTTRFRVGSNPEGLYVDLVCNESAQNRTFCAVAQDLLRSLRVSSGPPREIIVDALARWRAFWSAAAGGMNRQEALGLFGERFR